MPKLVIARGGVVVNLVNSPDEVVNERVWRVPDAQVVAVGDLFDDRDRQVDELDIVALQVTFRHENLIRQLIRALRASSAAANTAANAAGLPTAANSADVTVVQFKAAVKSLL